MKVLYDVTRITYKKLSVETDIRHCWLRPLMSTFRIWFHITLIPTQTQVAAAGGDFIIHITLISAFTAHMNPPLVT